MPTSSIRICWPSSTPNRPTRRSFPDWRRAAFALIYRSLTRRPGSRWCAGNCALEESPGSRETGRRLMAARREPRESATESKPPLLHGAVRVKGWGKSPPRDWRQDRHGKPRPEQDRIGGAHGLYPACAPGVSREVPGNRHPRGMAARPEQSGEQNPAYRPSGLTSRCRYTAAFDRGSNEGRRGPQRKQGLVSCPRINCREARRDVHALPPAYETP